MRLRGESPLRGELRRPELRPPSGSSPSLPPRLPRELEPLPSRCWAESARGDEPGEGEPRESAPRGERWPACADNTAPQPWMRQHTRSAQSVVQRRLRGDDSAVYGIGDNTYSWRCLRRLERQIAASSALLPPRAPLPIAPLASTSPRPRAAATPGVIRGAELLAKITERVRHPGQRFPGLPRSTIVQSVPPR